MTGFAVLGLLGAGSAESSLTEHTKLSKPKQSVAILFGLVFNVEGEAIHEVTDNAATDEAFDVLRVADDCLERLLPVCGFLGLREGIALEILLLADETLEAASD